MIASGKDSVTQQQSTISVSLTAEGERNAARGYLWQYDWIAERVLDAFWAEDLVEVRLVNADVGKVDDLVLVRTGRVDGFQFKSEEQVSYLTFR